MTDKEVCPGCGRQCSLREPGCERGREYLRTGKIWEHTCRHGEDRRPERHAERYSNADINDKLILNLRDIGQMMRSQYEGKASQKRILIILHESDLLTQKELTKRLGIQPGSASEILSKLENAGLIARKPNETDRRTTDIRLTDAGTALALQAAAQRHRRHQEMFSCLSSQEQETLLLLLEKLHADWESRFPAHRGGHGRCTEHEGHHRHGGSRQGKYLHPNE